MSRAGAGASAGTGGGGAAPGSLSAMAAGLPTSISALNKAEAAETAARAARDESKGAEEHTVPPCAGASVSAALRAAGAVAASHASRVTPRRSTERGHREMGWLDAYATFNFGTYDGGDEFDDWGCLDVLNEDWIQPAKGFGSE